MFEECDSCGKSLKNEPAACQEQGFCEPCLEQEVWAQSDHHNDGPAFEQWSVHYGDYYESNSN